MLNSKYIGVLLFISGLMATVSCEKKAQPSTEANTPQVIDSTLIQNAPAIKGLEKIKIKALPKRVQDIANQWPNFQEFDTKLQGFRTVSRPRLISYVEETETLYEELVGAKSPEAYDIPQIKSRLLVLRTVLLKLKDHADDPRFSDEQLLKEIQEVVYAYNAIKQQMTYIAQDDLDSDEYLNQP